MTTRNRLEGYLVLADISGYTAFQTGTELAHAQEMLKNHITETTGQRGYLFLTDACMEKMGAALDLPRHGEEYEHIGEVGGGMHNLKVAWQQMCENRRVFIGPAEADVVTEYDFAYPAAIVWDYMVDPAKNIQFQADILDWVNYPRDDGRMGRGASFHCDHGAFRTVQDYLDWRPFHYYTISMQQVPEYSSPEGPPPMFMTWEFTPGPDNTCHCTLRGRVIPRDPEILAFIPMLQEGFHHDFQECFRKLERILAEEAANFTLTVEET